jgi:putative PEP-CTERM system histidine kinase
MGGTVLWYALAGCSMAAAGVFLLMRRGQSEPARHAAVAVLVSAGWAGVLALEAYESEFSPWAVYAADGLRVIAWYVALESLASQFSRGLRRTVLFLCFALAAGAGIGVIWKTTPDPVFLQTLSALGVAGAVAALLAAFHVWRHAIESAAHRVRWSVAGASAMFACDALSYAQGRAGGDETIAVLRGIAVVLATIPLLRSVWSLPAPVPRVFISRQFTYYASTLIALCLYLGSTALAAWYARTHGGRFGVPLQAAIIIIALGVLIGMLLAEQPMRRLRVFISTHFYRNKYDYRIEWLRFVQTLSVGEGVDSRANAIRAVAQIFNAPSGLLLLRHVDSPGFHLQAAWPEVGFTDCTPVNASGSLAQVLASRQWVVDLREYGERRDIYGDLDLPAWLSPAGPWRLVVPLLVGDALIGMMVLRSPPEPFRITFEDRDLLKTVGRHVALQIAQRHADEQLGESRQFDAYNRFAAFVMHDLKNSVAQLQLLVDNAQRHRHNPEFFDDAIGTIRNTAGRMSGLIGQLQRRETQGTARAVELATAVNAAVASSQSRKPEVTVAGSLDGLLVQADPDRLAAVLEHAIRNAQEATPETGAVTVELQAPGEDPGEEDRREARVTVVDNGQGMDEDFIRNRLFRPFDSTKGVKGMGIGAYQVRQYARDLGGDVEVSSSPGKGTRFTIRLPAWPKTN